MQVVSMMSQIDSFLAVDDKIRIVTMNVFHNNVLVSVDSTAFLEKLLYLGVTVQLSSGTRFHDALKCSCQERKQKQQKEDVLDHW